MGNKTNKYLNISNKKLLLFFALFFAFMGIGRIWLWFEGAGNDLGLYLGLGFCLVSIINIIGYWRKYV